MSELLKEIMKKPGVTLTEMRTSKSLRKHYTQKLLDAEYSLLKKSHKIYEVKSSDNRRRAYVWDDKFKCTVCDIGLPSCRPSLKDASKCTTCDYNTRKYEDSPNTMMAAWALKPLFSRQTPDPRGYYGVAR
jgi:hypothetical protein